MRPISIQFIVLFLICVCLIWLSSRTNRQVSTKTSYEIKALNRIITDLEQQNEWHKEMENLMDKVRNVKNKAVQDSINQKVLSETQHRLLTSENQQNLPNQLIETQAKRGFSSSHSNAFAYKKTEKEDALKRRVRFDIQELIYSVQASIKELPVVNEAVSRREAILKSINIQQAAALIDAEDLVKLNTEWKEAELVKLGRLVQNRIRYSQNPPNCAATRKLVCTVNQKCGFGCQLHHISYCLMIAFGTNRTLVVLSKGWSYNYKGWESVFLPVSKTCSHTSGPLKLWDWSTQNEHNVAIYKMELMRYIPPFVPLNVPEDIAPQLQSFHGNPSVWWVGQFMRYIFRAQPWLVEEMESYEKQVDFSQPIVGIHVRRTDKIDTEASFHSIKEYMTHVDAWYDKYDLIHRILKKKVQRRVYIATDEPKVVTEAKQSHPNYVFVNIGSFSKSAMNVMNRYTPESLRGIIIDIHLLSKCDYIVCTFSSQVCRAAYELMQTLHPDASSYFHSLDDMYYYGGQADHNQRAIYDHHPNKEEEIELKVNDVIKVFGNHWNGFSKGLNKRTGESGLYPSWKVEEIITKVKYPKYPEENKPE